MFEDETSVKLVDLFSKEPLVDFTFFSVFNYSSELVLINEYVNGNQ